MIIRNGGGNKGIKEYLEEGRKVDRHMSRDELDKRIPIEGDLIVTQAVIDTIPDNKQERYLHITMSFNEPDVDEDKIKLVYEQYKKELMHAYSDDEFNIYAEIHWPKVKESYNHKTEAMEPRFPHVHIVLPKKNLLTGGFLNPLGMHEKSVKYIDAIQEKLNRDNGLSSPRENPRVGFNHYETALGKYKDKEFSSKNGEVKRDIHNALLSRDIRSVESFEQLLNEFGEVKIRNAGKPTQYFAIKISGDQKFTNLKGNLFTPEYIKDRSIIIDPITDAQIAKRIESWRSIQSLEIKYISNASAKVKEKYRDFTLAERRAYLTEREKSYAERYRKPESADRKRASLPSLPERNHKPGDFEFITRKPAERASYLHELRASNVDYFGAEGDAADRLFLSSDEDNDILDLPASGSAGLRRDLYAGSGGSGSSSSGSSQAGLSVPFVASDPQSSVLTSLLQAEEEKNNQQRDLERFAEIRKKLDPQHLLAYAQIKFGIDPANHPASKARDGSARIKVGKYNYNVSDFLTKHIGLEWAEASAVLTELYDKQQSGITDRPKDKVVLIDDWRRFRDEVYPKNIKTYDQLKNQIRVSFDLGLKAINAEYFARRKTITKDQTLTRSDKHYFRSVVILEKLQKIEALQQRIGEQNSLSNQVKYPYSTLFYDYATKNEEVSMKILDKLKARYQAPTEESINVIGGRRPMTPQNLPNGAEAVKRARLVAKLHAKERENKELKIKLGDLRPQPQKDGSVVFSHKDHGQRIFVNHPDRLEMNRKTEPDEVGVGLMFALERFGNPLEIGGSAEFKEQIILVAAERDMDITFTDESLNRALEAKRLELGLDPLVGNTITVPEPELDRALPLNEAVDQALLASKVAELNAVNNQPPYSMSEQATHTHMLLDVVARHEEIESGFIDNDRIEQIAKDDLEAFAYFHNKREQQPLAIAMGAAMQDPTYRAYVDQNGPEELQLTIDASRAIAAQPTAEVQPATQPQTAPEAPVSQVQTEPAVRFIRPDMGTALEEKDRLEQPATERDPQNFTDWTEAASMAARLHTDYNNEPRSPEYSRNVAAIAIEAQAAIAAGVGGDREFYGNDKAFHEAALVDDIARTMGENDYYASYIQNHAPSELTTKIEQVWGLDVEHDLAPDPYAELEAERREDERREYMSAAQKQAEDQAVNDPERLAELRAQHDLAIIEHIRELNDELSDSSQNPEQYFADIEVEEVERPAAPEPLNFTHNGEPATIDLERFQPQQAVEQSSAPAERFAVQGVPTWWDASLNGEFDQKHFDDFVASGMKDEPLRTQQLTDDEIYDEYLASQFENRGDEVREDNDREIERRSEAFNSTVERPAAPEPLNFTHNGEPATIDLERFQPQPQAEQPAPVEAVRPAAPEPLNFTHNGEPATIDLERFQQQPQAEQPAPAEVERPAAPEPLTFTHNGEPATIDLERFQQQPQAESVTIIHNGEPVTVDTTNAVDVAKYTRQLSSEVSLQSDRMEHAQQRVAELENMRDNHSAGREPEYLEQLAKEITDGNRSIEGSKALKEQAQESLQKLTAPVPQIERPAAPEPLNFTHNGQPATIDLERLKPQAREQVAPAVAHLAPAVAARVIELREVNKTFAKEDPDQVYGDIVRKGTLADANMRHDELDSGFVDSDKIREIASEDLKAFGYLEGKPEQQALALSMGRAMENEHYSAYMADNAPETVGVTIEASAVVSSEQQTMAPSEMQSPAEKDMEL